MIDRHTFLRLAFTTVGVLGALTACTSDRAPDQSVTPTTSPRMHAVVDSEYRFPIEWAGDYTYRWESADGIDLESSEAAVVRGFAEGWQLADAIGARLSLPGYLEAVPNKPTLRIPDGGSLPSGADEGDWKTRWTGTTRARILKIEADPEGFTAVYCRDSTDMPKSRDSGGTYMWHKPFPGIQGEPVSGVTGVLDVRRLSDIPTLPPQQIQMSGDSSALRAPNYNPFQGWEITDWHAWSGKDGAAPTLQEFAHLTDLTNDCNAWTRGNKHINPIGIDMPATTKMPADPPPTSEPPFPGWSARSR